MVNWQDLAEGTVLSRAVQDEVIALWRDRATSDFKREIRFFDFDFYGKPFTQVAIVLTPEKPLLVDGKRVVLVASEGGNDDGRDFLADHTGREGAGPFLARRGVTFISLTRLGRWNFFTDDPLGSWRDVPLNRRMPIFHRGQKQLWAETEYSNADGSGVSSITGSTASRWAREGSALQEHMIALTPATVLKGFETALDACIDLKRRDFKLFHWGFSTGGPYLWALAKRTKPDGILGYGMNNFAAVHFSTQARQGRYQWLYDRSAFRVRERGWNDFLFYAGELSEAEQKEQWEDAQKAPRFKSHEDTFMFFNVASLCETIVRLWQAPFLPADIRKRGFTALFHENLDLAFPDESLNHTAALELIGSQDEIIPPKDVAMVAASVVGPYLKRHKLAVLEGRRHRTNSQHAETFGSLWLDAIESGYFA